MKKWLFLILWASIISTVSATNFYVTSSGDDSNSGLDSTNAWLSIDNGDQTGVLNPGDTVFIYPGNYAPGSTLQLNTSGTNINYIVYNKIGLGDINIVNDFGNSTILSINGNYISVADLRISGSQNYGVVANGTQLTISNIKIENTFGSSLVVNGDSITIDNCLIDNSTWYGMEIAGNYNTYTRNVIINGNAVAIVLENSAEFENNFYHNVIINNKSHGIEFWKDITSARIFNNIISSNGGNGVKGSDQIIAGFNNIWGNSKGDYNGIVDSAGGISAKALFYDTTNNRYELLEGSLDINAGLDIGYEFNGPAPDIGAFEKYNTYYVSTSGDDENDGKTEGTAWGSIDFGSGILAPGDTVRVLPGTYSEQVTLTESGAAINDMITYKGIADATIIDGLGTINDLVVIDGDYVEISQMIVKNSNNENININGYADKVTYCQILHANNEGIYSSNSSFQALRNVVANSGDDGIQLNSGDSCVVANNTIYNNRNGIENKTEVNIFYNNILLSNDKGINSNDKSTASYSIYFNNTDDVSGGITTGFGSLLEDPLLVDTAAGDFNLRSNSPAVDAGIDDGSLFFGSAPDIGAYEISLIDTFYIVSNYDTLYADSLYQFVIVVLDSLGNPANAGNVSWSHTFTTGVIDSDGIFNPELIGTGEVIVTLSDYGYSDTTATMTIVPGMVADLAITPLTATITTDSTQQFSLTGTDSDGNATNELGSISWGLTNSLGDIDVTGLFSPHTVGKTLVTAASDIGPSVSSDTITVEVGNTSYIRVIPQSISITQDSSSQFITFGYDADSNFIKDLTDSVTWSTDDALGNVTATGLYTAGATPSPPNYYVTAVYQSFSDSGQVTVLTDGSISYFQIEYQDGTVVGDTTTTTDNDTTTFYCRGYASDSTLLGDISVQWNMLGVDSISSFSDSVGTSSSLTLTTPGTGQIEIVYSASVKDTSGTITVQTGAASEFIITPDTLVISSDSTASFSAFAYDADGNAVIPAVIPSWAVIGGIGTIDFTGEFDPTTVGVGNIVVSGAGIVDTSKNITVTGGALSYIEVTPDSIIVSADSQKQFIVIGYDIDNNETSEGIITWSVLDPLGSIDASGIFDAVTVGETKIIAESNLGPVDTSAFLQIVPGSIALLTIAPDSLELRADSTYRFSVTGTDSDGNDVNPGSITWGVIGSIGTINPVGQFNPNAVGVGQITAENSLGIVDTNTAVVVTSGELNNLVVLVDTTIINANESLQFSTIGYDIDFNLVDVGSLSWSTLHGKGSVSDSGLFVSSEDGYENIIVTSSINGIADTSETITIEALQISKYGNEAVPMYPNTDDNSILVFEFENQYIRDKQISSITIHDASSGFGSSAQVRSNIDSVSLYLDVNEDLLISGADLLLDKQPFIDDSTIFSFPSVTLSTGDILKFILSVDVALYPREGDSLNVLVLPESDIEIGDATPIIGLDSLYCMRSQSFNGLTTEQIHLTSVATDTIRPNDSILHLLTVDIPRNGYQEDTLKIINIINTGTAEEADIDSMILFRDIGNDIWDDTDNPVGKLSFTGDRWTRSGLSIPLSNQTTRFYLVGYMNKYPTNGATISLTIPQYGLEMSSSNDGPIDQNVTPVDTIPILTDEKVAIEVVQLPSRDLTPGVESGPLLNLLFSNLYSMNIGVDSIQFDYIGNDPDGASQNLQSSQFSSINLYLQRDRNTDGISSEDTLIAEGVLVNGQIVFSTSGLTLNKNGGNTVLTVTADLDMNNSKNGNTVAFQLSDSALIYVDQPVIFNTTFPLLNQDAFTINSFPANAVTLHTVSGTTIFGGQNRKLVLDFELPANGYEDDTLKSIRIQNIGSQSDSEAVASLDLWYDIDDNGFTLNDLKLGTFTENTSYWEINHIDHYIPVGGKRYFVTTDIYNTNFSGGTLQYEIIQGGCTYSSGMTGPDDAPLENPEEHVVFPSNRITAISLPASEEIILPGGPEKTMLSFALYNGYTDRDQILNSIGLTNISKTLSSPDYSDYELGSISLYYDTDNSGTLNETTPVANGRFINNKLNLSGLNITLPKEELSYFFVVSDFPNSLIDSDSLAISIAAPSDFGFVENVNINGALPLSRGSYLIVDGSSKAQYTIYPVSPKTLSPGDMQVSLFAFSPAINGDLGDRLDSLRIENTGTADNTDITALHLWLDLNNDSLWQDTDSMLTSLTYSSGAWEAGNLNLQFNTLSPILFVTGDISASATPDRTFNTRIPLNGFEYLSENDGPRDLPIIDVNTFTISGSNLRVEIAQMKPTYSVGETISISLKATNLSPSPLTNMICNIISISDSQAVSLESSNIGPIDLNAGENYDFTYHYTADSASLLNWQFQVVAVDINDSSAIVISPLIQIQNTPVDIPLVLINSMPTAVTKGQSNVFPLSLTISHPDSLPTSAPIRLDSLFLSIEDASGQSQLASALFSRVVLTAGYDILSVLETIPNLSTVPMYFDDPLVINVNEQKNLTLLIDIDSAATALDMVLSINTGSDIPLTDYNNNQSLTIDPSVVFPLKTASCRIDNPSNIMEIAFKPTLKPNANYGQENVNLIGFEISHPGGQSSSQIQLTSLSFELFDESDNLIIINDIFNRIKVRKQFSIVADISDNLDSSSVQIQLASPITLNPGERDSLYILADINNLSTVSGFKLQIADSTSFVVRDLSSGSLITVTADTNSLVTSSLFPITTSTATLKLSAESPEICFQSVLSPSVIRGKDSLDLINLSIDYPYSTAYSPVVLQSMLLYCLDSLERPIDPISLFDRIGYKVNNSLTINYQPFIQLLSGAILFNFETDSIILAAGDSLDLIIVGDIEADAPYDHFRLMISEPQSFELNDQTDTTYMPLVAFDANCSQSYPLQTSIATIISPAGRPGVNAESSEVTAIYAGQQDVVLFSTALHYDQQSHQGDLLFSSLQGYLKKRTQSGYSSYNGVQIFDNVRLLIDGIPYAADSVLADDLLELQADSGVVISNGESAEISIVADINQNAQMGNYRLEFLDSTFIDIEDLQLATNVYPILLSGSYPVLSTELSLASANLKESFSNYPNPFTDETTITFVMEENGRVDIELYTITGKSVLTLVDDEYRSAGVYNSDKWYGKNAEDLPVVAGTYFCRITVRYDSQKEESELRKISVIR